MTFQPTRPGSYTGVRAPTPINLWTRARDPNAQDLALYTIGDLWYNKAAVTFWILTDTGAFGALWELFTFGAGSLDTLTGNDAIAVTSVAGNINVTSTSPQFQFTSGGAGNLNFSPTPGSSGVVTWNVISAPQALSINNGYICVAPGGALSLSLPAVSSLGDIIEITLDGSGSFTVTMGVAQQIRIGDQQTSLGGSLSSNAQGDTVRMVCQTANTKWNVLSGWGNLTWV